MNIWSYLVAISNCEMLPHRLTRFEMDEPNYDWTDGNIQLFYADVRGTVLNMMLTDTFGGVEFLDNRILVKGESIMDVFKTLRKITHEHFHFDIASVPWRNYGMEEDVAIEWGENIEHELSDNLSIVTGYNMPIPGERFGLAHLDSQLIERVVKFNTSSGALEDVLLMKFNTANYSTLCNSIINGVDVYDTKTKQKVIVVQHPNLKKIDAALDVTEQDTHSFEFHAWCADIDAKYAAIDVEQKISDDEDFKAWCNEQAYYYNQLEFDKQREQKYEFDWCGTQWFNSYSRGVVRYSRGYWLVKYEYEIRWCHHTADDVTRFEWPVTQTIYFETLEKALMHLKHHGAIIQPAD